MHAYLSLGSNIGDRVSNLFAARRILREYYPIFAESSVYETEPWGYEDQPQFLNQVIEVKVDVSPMEFLRTIKRIEDQLGRAKSFKYGPRSIDIDILTYGKMVFRSERLNIPHSMLGERAFVLVPLDEIAPEFTHPENNFGIRELLDKIPTDGVNVYPG